MKFGAVALPDAEGAVLAHSEAVPGGRLRKGRVLRRADLARLAEAGLREVVVARLEPGDVGEDAAAERLARALVPSRFGVRLSAAATGRVNVIAEAPGLVRLDAAAIAAVNAVDPMITVATLPALQRVQAGALIATIKIIAYGVPGAALEAAVVAAGAGAGSGGGSGGAAGAEGEGVIGLHVPRVPQVALIETVIGGQAAEDAASDKGEAALRTRLARLGVGFAGRLCLPHDTEALAAALRAADAPVVCLLLGSATSDPRDTGPAALRAAGGEVIRFGMPVDPGNLLFLGRIGERVVIGLPGCARSPALNGADWVLERVLCGVEVSAGDIAAMGVGGLLKESPARGLPRRTPG